jgi:integrase
VIAAAEYVGTVITMIQPPRTTTRKIKTSKPVVRKIDATLRLDAIEVEASSLAPQLPSPIWEELATMATENTSLLELVDRAKELATSGQLMDNSIKSYAGLWRPFTRWCDGMGLASLPACSATVLLYVAYRSGQHLSPDTISGDLSAIRSYHLRAGFTNPADHAAVSMARQSVARHHAAHGASKKKAHPLTLEEVRSMVECLDQLPFQSPKVVELLRIRIKAVLLIAWFAGRRLDEIARADLGWLKERDGVLFLESNYQKMKRNGFSTPIEKIADRSLCPWTALQAWLDASAPFRGDVQRIFALPKVEASGEIMLKDTLYDAGQVKMAKGWRVGDPRYPTKADFEAKCRAEGLGVATRALRLKLIQWMKLAGIEPDSGDRGLSGHSMRRGLVTQLRSAGVDSRVIADHVGLATIDLVEAYSDAVSKVRVLDVLDL